MIATCTGEIFEAASKQQRFLTYQRPAAQTGRLRPLAHMTAIFGMPDAIGSLAAVHGVLEKERFVGSPL